MSIKVIDIKTLKLAYTKDGTISVAHLEQPYGEYSSPVVSIGVAIIGEEREWKVHIPYENLDDVISALNDARKMSDGLQHVQSHVMDLGAETGGGQ